MPEIEVSPDYTWDSEDDKVMGNYFTKEPGGNRIDLRVSDSADSDFHDQDSSLIMVVFLRRHWRAWRVLQ